MEEYFREPDIKMDQCSHRTSPYSIAIAIFMVLSSVRSVGQKNSSAVSLSECLRQALTVRIYTLHPAATKGPASLVAVLSDRENARQFRQLQQCRAGASLRADSGKQYRIIVRRKRLSLPPVELTYYSTGILAGKWETCVVPSNLRIWIAKQKPRVGSSVPPQPPIAPTVKRVPKPR